MHVEVKIKFDNGEIVGFNPFKVCASMPPQYTLKNHTTGKKMYFEFTDKFIHTIENNGIETNNIQYLEECNIKANHLKLNLDL